MHIDLEKKEKWGCGFYEPALEDGQDSAIYSLAVQSSETSYRIQKILEKIETPDQEETNEKADQDEWLLEPTSLPANLSHIYSVSGLELIGPKIYVHFYPNGTSDSIIFEFDREEQKYLYLPRHSMPSVYLDDLKITKELQF